MNSENRTPCLLCIRSDEDKNLCAPICRRLNVFRRDGEWTENVSIPTLKELKKRAPSEGHEEEHNEDQSMAEAERPEQSRRKATKQSPKPHSSESIESKICDVEGCEKEAKVRGKCRPHYNAWQAGRLPGQPPFKIIQKQTIAKKRGPKPKSPIKTKSPSSVIASKAKQSLETIPESQIIIDLAPHPQLRDVIFATAQKFLVNPSHIIIMLAGEALAARNEKKK